MSENLVWLLYFLGSAGAFALVWYKGWKPVPAALLPALVVTAIWLAAVWLGKKENEPFWFRLDLALNFTFALIFAAAGAGLAQLLRDRRREDP